MWLVLARRLRFLYVQRSTLCFGQPWRSRIQPSLNFGKKLSAVYRVSGNPLGKVRLTNSFMLPSEPQTRCVKWKAYLNGGLWRQSKSNQNDELELPSASPPPCPSSADSAICTLSSPPHYRFCIIIPDILAAGRLNYGRATGAAVSASKRLRGLSFNLIKGAAAAGGAFKEGGEAKGEIRIDQRNGAFLHL